MSYKDTVAGFAVVLTIFLFLSGSLICRKIMKLGHTGSYSAFTFVSGVFNTGVWLTYGLMIHDSAMIVTNAVGVITQVAYLLLFSLYCSGPGSKSVLRKQMTVLLGVMGSIFYYVIFSAAHVDLIKIHVGFLGCIGSIVFCASPLVSLAEVVKTKSTAILPFPLILLVFLVTSTWAMYGYLIEDTFVMLPNLIGSFISTLQLMLFLVYTNSETTIPMSSPSKGLLDIS